MPLEKLHNYCHKLLKCSTRTPYTLNEKANWILLYLKFLNLEEWACWGWELSFELCIDSQNQGEKKSFFSKLILKGVGGSYWRIALSFIVTRASSHKLLAHKQESMCHFYCNQLLLYFHPARLTWSCCELLGCQSPSFALLHESRIGISLST